MIEGRLIINEEAEFNLPKCLSETAYIPLCQCKGITVVDCTSIGALTERR